MKKNNKILIFILTMLSSMESNASLLNTIEYINSSIKDHTKNFDKFNIYNNPDDILSNIFTKGFQRFLYNAIHINTNNIDSIKEAFKYNLKHYSYESVIGSEYLACINGLIYNKKHSDKRLSFDNFINDIVIESSKFTKKNFQSNIGGIVINQQSLFNLLKKYISLNDAKKLILIMKSGTHLPNEYLEQCRYKKNK